MSSRTAAVAALVSAFAVSAPTAHASGLQADEDFNETWSVGSRIGGYGFRHAAADSLEWDDCRMNGVGVFAQRRQSSAVYLQLSLDGYHATQETVNAGMDRLSLLTVGAVGARLENRTPIWPHVEIGVGAELTQVELGEARDTRVLPTGYVGAGAEIAIRRVRFGMTIRALAMGLPAHEHADGDHAKHDHGEVPGDGVSSGGGDAIRFDTEVAGQLTFSLRYAF